MTISPAQPFQMLLNESWPRQPGGNAELIFPADSTPCQHLKLGLKPRSGPSCCCCPERGSRAVHTQRGGSGQPRLPRGHWAQDPTSNSSVGIGADPTAGSPRHSRARGSPRNHPGAALAAAPCPKRDFPDLWQGQPLPFPRPVSPHCSP